MVCISGTVDILSVIVFLSINIVSTLGQYGVYTSGTADKLCVKVFVSISIVSTLG